MDHYSSEDDPVCTLWSHISGTSGITPYYTQSNYEYGMTIYRCISLKPGKELSIAVRFPGANMYAVSVKLIMEQ